MTDKLTPLSPADAAIFETRRESAAVVQHKCAGCGSWYETAKASVEFQETFVCDCGEKLTFPVPALDVRAPLSNSELLDLFDPAAKLDTGMTVKEAVARAQAWWERTGRRLMTLDRSRRKTALHGAKNRQGFTSADPGDPRFLPSGILNALPWDSLGKRERLIVVKVWHHFNIRKADLIGDPDERFRAQSRDTIN